MAKLELFQATLNNLLEKIRLDAINCLENPPEKHISDYNETDLEDKALEYHEKGDVGTYLYFLCLREIKGLEKDLKEKK
jgi:hypothetical protein